MIPRFCHVKIGCKCNGEIIKWNVHLMTAPFCMVKTVCKCTPEIIKWKSKMLQKIGTSLLRGKNCVRRNKEPDMAMSVLVVRYLDTNKGAIPGSTAQVESKHATKHQTINTERYERCCRYGVFYLYILNVVCLLHCPCLFVFSHA